METDAAEVIDLKFSVDVDELVKVFWNAVVGFAVVEAVVIVEVVVEADAVVVVVAVVAVKRLLLISSVTLPRETRSHPVWSGVYCILYQLLPFASFLVSRYW